MNDNGRYRIQTLASKFRSLQPGRDTFFSQLSVCLSPEQLRKLWMDFPENWEMGILWIREELVEFVKLS